MRILGLLVVATLALSACASASDEPDAGGSWRVGAALPMGPRWAPVVVWTGEEAIVVGGGNGSPCPPNADCTAPDTMARDGAAYDPESDTWRPIADAPVPVGYWFRPVVVGDLVVLFDGNRRWFAYDVADDTWSRLPAPPVQVADTGAISASHGRVLAVAESGRVLVLDPVRRWWSRLPLDDQRPKLEPTGLIAGENDVFVCGPDPATPEDGDTPRFTVVDQWDGNRWTRLPITGSVGNLCEHWTGTRLVSADIQVATGLDGDPPSGGRLEPATGEWSPLPGAPDLEKRAGVGWYPHAAAGPLIASWGYVYDDDAETWTPLGKPDSEVDYQQSAVWDDGDELLVFGGLDEETAYQDPSGLSDETWVWVP